MDPQPLLLVLSIAVIILIVVIVTFLVLLISFLFTLRRTLLRLRQAIDTVEDQALRSLSPFLSLKALFSNTDGFMNAFRSVIRAIKGKKKSV